MCLVVSVLVRLPPNTSSRGRISSHTTTTRDTNVKWGDKEVSMKDGDMGAIVPFVNRTFE